MDEDNTVSPQVNRDLTIKKTHRVCTDDEMGRMLQMVCEE